VKRRAVITGLGAITPLGNDVRSTWDALLGGRSGAGPITRFDPVLSPVKFACEVKGFDPARFLEKKEIRRYDLFAQLAIGAAEEAVTDACLASNWDAVDRKRVGVLIGTGTGASGWCRSVWLERGSPLTLPEPQETALIWFVREAWPSPATGTTLTEGVLDHTGELVIDAESDRLVVFGDGIESDAIPLTWGQSVSVRVAEACLHTIV